ncbi:hypothetical protein IFM89_034158 [Coptis chinensis]|uniref:Uncharacterized protein n=1 Tax=Coptis chinensis TaxID=261450 RepID=A0A835HTW2_9MAGN|nr:hypothetical protein IFM89_034158 [Coptis chinensis]
MPKYCPHCKAVGHVMAEWKVLKKIRVEEEANNNEANEAQKQKTHRRKKRRKRGIGTKTEPIPEEVQTNHVEGIVHTTQTVGAGALVVHLDCSDLPSHIRIMTPLGETISVEGEVDNGVIPPDLVVSQALVVMSDSQSTGNRASSPRTPNQLPALQEADKLLGSSSWAEQVEEGEWQVQKKKNPNSKWMEQILSPPHTRARNTTSGD